MNFTRWESRLWFPSGLRLTAEARISGRCQSRGFFLRPNAARDRLMISKATALSLIRSIRQPVTMSGKSARRTIMTSALTDSGLTIPNPTLPFTTLITIVTMTCRRSRARTCIRRCTAGPSMTRWRNSEEDRLSICSAAAGQAARSTEMSSGPVMYRVILCPSANSFRRDLTWALRAFRGGRPISAVS